MLNSYQDYTRFSYKDLPAYAEVKEVLHRINTFYLEEIDVWKDASFSSEIERFCNTLEQEIKIISPSLFEEIEAEGKRLSGLRGVDITLSKWINSENKEVIATYLYWKYVVITQQSKRFSVGKFRKYFGLKVNHKYDLAKFIRSLIFSHKCSKCGKDGEVTSKEKGTRFSFQCAHCGHSVFSSYYDGADGCDCKECLNEIQNLHQSFIKAMDSLIQQAESLIDSTVDHIIKGDEEKGGESRNLYRKYIINQSELTRMEALFIKLRPKNTQEDIWECTHDAGSKIFGRKFSEVDALKKLEAKGVIYKTREQSATKQELVNLSIESFFANLMSFNIDLDNSYFIGNNYTGVKAYKVITDFLMNLRDFEFFRKSLSYKTFIDKRHQSLKTACFYGGIKDSVERAKTIDVNYRFASSLMASFSVSCEPYTYKLNPYYFDNAESEESSQVGEGDELFANVKPLFNSKSEEKTFQVIQAKNPKAIIVPNKRLKDIVDIAQGIFSKEEFSYLNRCICDYTVYNDAGKLLKIVELQKGPHHDEPEWQKKDAIKRNACKQLGIVFEEIY